MAIPTTAEWSFLAFVSGLDISGWFDSIFEGADWVAAPGGGWGVRYKRRVGDTAIEVIPAITQVITPAAPIPLPASWRTYITIEPPPGPGLAKQVIYVAGGSVPLGKGNIASFTRGVGATTWDVQRQDPGTGLLFTVASGLDLTPTPGDAIAVEMTYNAAIDRVTVTANGNDCASLVPFTGGPFPFTQDIAINDPSSGTWTITEWKVGAGLHASELLPFDRQMGTQQGRIQPNGWTPISGQWVYCLGSDSPDVSARIANGDYVEIVQRASFGDRTVVRVSARVRCPPLPAVLIGIPNWWSLIVRIDGSTRATRVLTQRPGNRTRIRDMEDVEVCVADLAPGDHDLSFRLQWDCGVLIDPVEWEVPGVYLDLVEMVTP